MNTFSSIIFSYYSVKLYLRLKFPLLQKMVLFFFEGFSYYHKMSNNDLNCTYESFKHIRFSVFKSPQLFRFKKNVYI